MLQLWRHALAPEPRVARQGLESGHTLTVCGLLGTLAQNKLVSLNPSRGRLQAQRADLFYEVTYGARSHIPPTSCKDIRVHYLGGSADTHVRHLNYTLRKHTSL